ncbi:MAG: DUF2970 domain-containing protein [Burkholderiaceae bacterium]|jgi:hypothetical protein
MSHAPVTPPRAPSSIGRTIRMVAWSFVGIRKNSEYRQDLAQANPVHIIAVGIAGALLFVGGLIALVHWVAG